MNVDVEVRRWPSYEVDGPLSKFMDDLRIALMEIPEALRPSAKVRVEGGEYSADVVITFERPETDDERCAREEQTRVAMAKAEDSERQQLARLMAKYGVRS